MEKASISASKAVVINQPRQGTPYALKASDIPQAEVFIFGRGQATARQRHRAPSSPSEDDGGKSGLMLYAASEIQQTLERCSKAVIGHEDCEQGTDQDDRRAYFDRLARSYKKTQESLREKGSELRGRRRERGNGEILASGVLALICSKNIPAPPPLPVGEAVAREPSPRNKRKNKKNKKKNKKTRKPNQTAAPQFQLPQIDDVDYLRREINRVVETNEVLTDSDVCQFNLATCACY
jgi:hypothetical protein